MSAPGPMRVLVVDDEPLARRGIRARLERAGGTEVVGECVGGREAVAAIRAHAPDLVFLDVQMPGMDGFAVVAEIGADAMPDVIFVTAYDAHALRAFDANALDYLLKPIDDERFARALERARRRRAERQAGRLAARLLAVMVELQRPAGDAADSAAPAPAVAPDTRTAPAVPAAPGAPPATVGRFAVRDRGRVLLVDAADVDWLEADGDYVRLHAGGRAHLVRETMAAMAARLDPARFARIHRSTIVNVSRIRALEPWMNREYVVILHDGTRLKLSRGYRDRLASLLGDAL